jgi:hypothetical protein
MDAAGDDKIVEVVSQKTETGAQIRFRRLGGLVAAPLDRFPAERERNLLNLLRAELMISAENNEFVVELAADINRD